MKNPLAKIGLDSFVVALLLAILAAWLAPGIGSRHGDFSPSAAASWGITIIFFFYGLRLSPSKFREGLRNVKLHTTIHLVTFVFFPLLILGAMWAFGVTPGLGGSYSTGENLWLGVFFMAALPSTVSSAVVMVSLAKGNVPAAVFNASLSSLLGVVLTPLWMSIFLTSGGGASTLDKVLLDLLLQVVLPIGLGMLLNRRLGEWAVRHAGMLSFFDKAVIVAIVYTSFCESFLGGMFESVSWWTLLVLIAGLAVVFGVVYGSVSVASRWLGFDRGDRITALFCGSKKSLVHGTVMSKVLVREHSAVGLLLLPTMVYHALQLVIVSVIAQRMAKRCEE